MQDQQKVSTAATAIRDATNDLSDEEKKAAVEDAGIRVPGPRDVSDTAWKRMAGWQVMTVLLVMFLGLAALLVFLVFMGADLITAGNASEAAKAAGNTLIGAAVGLLGGAAVGGGATAVTKK